MSGVRTETEVEVIGRFGTPQSHGVDTIVIVARNGGIVRHGQDNLAIHPLGFTLFLDDTPIKVDGNHVLRASLFPRVAIPEPVIGNLDLNLYVLCE